MTVYLALQEPGPDTPMTQAVTSPFAVVVIQDIQDLDPKEKFFSFVVKLNWKVVPVDV